MLRARPLALSALLALPPVLLPTAPAAHAQIPAAEYEARRDSLAARTGPGVLLAFGAPDFVGHHFEMRQLPAFEYLTGFREPDAVFVMVTGDDAPPPSLFTHTPTIRTQLYDGFREAPESLAERTGFRVRPLEELGAHVDSLARAGLPFFDLRDFETADYAARDSLTRGTAFVERLRRRHPDLRVVDAHPHVSGLRARKSPGELALLRRAIAITDEAHLAALAAIRPGAFEYEVEAAIEAAFRSRGADGPAYSSIVGSGPNSTILHYVDNDRRMVAGDLVVMDVGAAFDGYAADITRTAPVSGRFTAEQREVYDIVLASQKAAERLVAPGAPAAASLEAATAVRLEGLVRLGLIQSAEATFDPPWPVDCEARPSQCLQGTLFMIHGISHGIGLEVHDPAQFYTGDRTYGVGDVFTIEPGLYISTRALDLLEDTPRNRAFVAAVRAVVERYDQIGVRIEDDYVVTAEGYERLSTGSPREANEIEAAMARARESGRAEGGR